MRRRHLLKVIGRGVTVALLGSLIPASEGFVRSRDKKSQIKEHGLLGKYGFITANVLGYQTEAKIRARIAVMAEEYGIREFQFYDWFADYSTPLSGGEWTDPYFHHIPISRRTIETCIDEIHRQGGRAWAYVQAIASEDNQLENPHRNICKLRDAKGAWYWHPHNVPNPRFPTYFANGPWAEHMVEIWASPVKQLGFDGIHWDTLGRIAGDYAAETVGIHAFLSTTHGLLQNCGLRQTMNMVDLAWWDRGIVRDDLEFPYAEVWSSQARDCYFSMMDEPEMAGIHGVFAMYPSVAVPEGVSPDWVICDRMVEGRRHRLAYLIVGDGARRMKNEYWPHTIPLTARDSVCLKQ